METPGSKSPSSPDWRRIVRGELPALRLPPEREAALVDELAQLLEDYYVESDLCRGEPSDEEIAAWVRLQVPMWTELAGMIERVERPFTRLRKERPAMTSWFHDLRYAWRMLAKNPGFSFVAVLTLAVAIGLNSSVWSVVNAVLFKPLPAHEPEHLVRIYTEYGVMAKQGMGHLPLSYPDLEDIRKGSSFSDVIGYSAYFLSLEIDAETELVTGALATGNYFSALGIEPAIGRAFAPEEDQRGAAQGVAVLNHTTWQRRFGADPGVVGRELRVNGHVLTIIGVAPEGFDGLTYPIVPELWVPMGLAETLGAAGGLFNIGDDIAVPLLEDRAHHWLFAMGRLAPGVAVGEARAELETLAATLTETYPKTNTDMGLTAVPATEVRILPEFDMALSAAGLVVMAIVALVLLIAAANLANMLLARAVARRKEIATRLALGGSRRQLLRQLLIESLLLALLGGGGGLLMAMASNRALSTLPSISSLPFRVDLGLGLDASVVLFTLAISTFSAVAFGLAPAFEALKTDLATTLRESPRGIAGGGRRRLRHALVVAQVAFSLLLLICAGLSVRSMMNAHRVDPGFTAEGVVAARFAPDFQGYARERSDEFYRQLEERLSRLSEVESIAFSTHAPLGLEGNMAGILPAGSEPTDNLPFAGARMITPGYFETLGVPLLQGRDFTDDDTTDSPKVVIINRHLAEMLWPGESAIGKQVDVYDARAPRLAEVVGVVQDSKYKTLGEDPTPWIAWPFTQDVFNTRMIFVRTSGPPQAALAALRQTAREIDPHLAVSNLSTLEELSESSLLLPRVGARLFGLFGLVGLILAAIGLYGVMAYAVSQRRHEIGVRMAMGADRGEILRLVLRQGALLTVGGVVLGLGAALASTRVLSSILYGIGATDLVTFVAVPLLLAAVAVLASWLPAHRAASVDPLDTLRYE